MWMDWNDPDRTAAPARSAGGEPPGQTVTTTGADGEPLTRYGRAAGRPGSACRSWAAAISRSRMRTTTSSGRSWPVPQARLVVQGPRLDAVVRPLRHRHQPARDDRGYADRQDPGLTVKFPLLDRPGEALLVWTTTPWTLTSNVAAAVGEEPALRQSSSRAKSSSGSVAGRSSRRSRGRSRSSREARPRAGRLALRGSVRRPAGGPGRFRGGRHRRSELRARVVTWDEVGEEEGTGIVHIAPGCGAEDFALGRELGLPMIAPLD